MSGHKKEAMKMCPIRSFNDFILDFKRFQPPALNDLKRFNNRVVSNLLYYQTNYFVVMISVFLLFTLFGMNKILIGATGIATTGAVILFQLDKIPQASPLRAQYPIALIVVGLLNLVTIYITFRPILYFMLAVLIPIALSIIHASVRSRGLKNKINNKVEQFSGQVYSNTPMGIMLSYLGLEPKDFEE